MIFETSTEMFGHVRDFDINLGDFDQTFQIFSTDFLEILTKKKKKDSDIF